MSDWSIHPPWSSDSLSGLRNSPMVSATHWVGSVAQGYSAPEIGMSYWSIHPPWSSDSLSGLRNSPMVSATHWVGSVAQGYSAPEIGMSYWSIHPPWSSDSLGGLRSHPRGHRDSLDGNRLLRATQLLACLSCRRLVDATAVAGGRLLCAGPSLAPGSNHPPWSS
jgi:hypothetical protein